MSTKVYVAYKLDPKVTRNHAKFWKWIRETLHRGEQEVAKVIRETYVNLMKDIKEDHEEFQRLRKEHGDYFSRLTFVHDTMARGFKASTMSHERHLFDFDVTVSIRELKGDLYVIPYADMLVAHTLDFMKEDKRLLDFCYWNNTDPPEGMREGLGYRRWQERGRVWDKLNDNGWREYLLITVCDFSKFMYVDPWLDMIREHHDAEKEAKRIAEGTPKPPE